MSEDFSNKISAKYSDVNSSDYYQSQINNISENIDKILHPYDHIYASKNDNSNIETHKHKLNCQTAESEVRFLKQWLLLHLDLIQHQNEEILSKERSILILQQENEMVGTYGTQIMSIIFSSIYLHTLFYNCYSLAILFLDMFFSLKTV